MSSERETPCTAGCTCPYCMPDLTPDDRQAAHRAESLDCGCMVCRDWLDEQGYLIL